MHGGDWKRLSATLAGTLNGNRTMHGGCQLPRECTPYKVALLAT